MKKFQVFDIYHKDKRKKAKKHKKPRKLTKIEKKLTNFQILQKKTLHFFHIGFPTFINSEEILIMIITSRKQKNKNCHLLNYWSACRLQMKAQLAEFIEGR